VLIHQNERGMTDITERLYLRVLVLRCQSGDAAAFEELVERYSPQLRYYLRKLLESEADRADDLLQDVWFDVFQSVSRLADPEAFSAWLYRIARDRAFREFRKRRTPHRSIEGMELADCHEDDEEFSAVDAVGVHAALDTLSVEHREVLVLRFLEGMAYEDIARVIGRSVGTVRSRIHYAKGALRRAIERANRHD